MTGGPFPLTGKVGGFSDATGWLTVRHPSGTKACMTQLM